MARLIYSMLTSLDGYIEDENGSFDWAEPDEEVHAFINDLQRNIGTELYGRRMYEVMVAWESPELITNQPKVFRDYAEIWQSEEKIVFSRTLDKVSSARTRIEREFDPDAIRQLKETAALDIAVSGPELAASAFEAGLVDEYQLFIAPIIVGGGKQSLPRKFRSKLELLDERRFRNGMVYLHYRTRPKSD